jgi:hypothetical protein
LSELFGTRRKILWLLRLQHRRLRRQLRLATLGGSSSRTRASYRHRSGVRYQLAPECKNSPSRPTISSTSVTQQSHQCSGARQQLRLRSWLWFYDNNSTTSSSITVAPTSPHQIKAKFSSSKNRLLFTFAAPYTQGLRHKKSSCISLTLKKLWKP